MASWSSWLPDVRRLLPECPDPLIEHAVKRAAQEFCSRTRAWKKLLDPVEVEGGATSVSLIPDSGTEVVSVLNVWCDGRDLNKTTAEELFKDDPKWITSVGLPISWFEEEPGQIRLYPISESGAAIGLVALVSLKPSEAAMGVSDLIASKYRTHIADKALSILMMDPGKTWTNPEQASFRLALFESDTDAIRTRLALGLVRVRASPSWC